MQFESILLNNLDDTVVEARNLLHAWIPESSQAAREPACSYLPSDYDSGDEDSLLRYSTPPCHPSYARSARKKKQIERDHIRHIVAEALEVEHDKRRTSGGIKPSTRKMSSAGSSSADPCIVMEARRCLARERKAKQDAERAMELRQRLLEKDRRAQLRLLADKTQKEEEEAETRRVEACIRTAKEAVSLEAEEMRKQKDLEKQKQMEELLQEIERQQRGKKVELAAKAILEEEERRRDWVYTKVDEMFALHCLRCVHANFSAWFRRAATVKANMHQFQVICAWKMCNRYWAAWKASRDRRMHERKVEETARELKRERENMLRSFRHYRMVVLSQTFLQWSTWAKLQNERRHLLREHERRAAKMAEVLQKAKESLISVEAHGTADQKEGNWGVKVAGLDISAAPQADRPQSRSANGPGHDVLSKLWKPDGGRATPETQPVANSSLNYAPPSQNVERPAARPILLIRPPEKRTHVIRTDTRLLQGMAQRELEREQRKQAREQRLKERAERQRREEAEKLKTQEEEAERQRLEALAKEQEEKERIEKERLRAIELSKRAKAHTKNRLLQFFALRPWKRLVDLQRICVAMADQKYSQYLIRSVGWNALLRKVRRKQEIMEQQAMLMVLEQTWASWKMAVRDLDLRRQSSCKTYNAQLMRRMFGTWQCRAKKEMIKRVQVEAEQNAKAESLATRLVPSRFFRKWCVIHRTEKEERWHEYRRQVMREKVRGWLYNSRLQPEEEAAAQVLLTIPPS